MQILAYIDKCFFTNNSSVNIAIMYYIVLVKTKVVERGVFTTNMNNEYPLHQVLNLYLGFSM